MIAYYSGAERVVYELYKEFKREGDEIHLGTGIVGDFYNEMLFPARINDIPLYMDEYYDLIIVLHTHTFGYLFPLGVKCKRLLYFSLSPYEPVEFPFHQENIIDGYLANSMETKNKLTSEGITEEKIRIFNNSVYFDADVNDFSDAKPKLKNILIVSNHLPEELREMITLESEINFFIAGADDCTYFIDSKYLKKFDAIVSIGYTVVISINAKVPVYMYDHFGGDGWLTENNLILNSDYNFSGRPKKIKKSAFEILNEIENGFCEAKDSIESIYRVFKKERNISDNVRLLRHEICDKCLSQDKIPNIYMVNSAKTFFNLLKSNQNLELKMRKNEEKLDVILLNSKGVNPYESFFKRYIGSSLNKLIALLKRVNIKNEK